MTAITAPQNHPVMFSQLHGLYKRLQKIPTKETIKIKIVSPAETLIRKLALFVCCGVSSLSGGGEAGGVLTVKCSSFSLRAEARSASVSRDRRCLERLCESVGVDAPLAWRE
jgi:hypothetical protein